MFYSKTHTLSPILLQFYINLLFPWLLFSYHSYNLSTPPLDNAAYSETMELLIYDNILAPPRLSNSTLPPVNVMNYPFMLPEQEINF